MKPKPTIVCLCGSTRFKEEFIFANFTETRAGKIVLSVGFFNHADKHFPIDGQEKEDADELHKRKIDISGEILVIDPIVSICRNCNKPCMVNPLANSSDCCKVLDPYFNSYIGESTRSEINYAMEHDKKIRYWTGERIYREYKR
jgi:hypothetical protein